MGPNFQKIYGPNSQKYIEPNRVHQNVSLHISFLIFYCLIGCIILLPQEVVL